jgi:outer membrane protein assembly factor BamA
MSLYVLLALSIGLPQGAAAPAESVVDDQNAVEEALQRQADAELEREGEHPDASCEIVDPRGHTVRLTREGTPWQSWPAMCATLVHYLKLPSTPLDANSVLQVQHNLAPLGYFEKIQCQAPHAKRLECTLKPAHMVKTYRLRGHVPFTLLQEDLRRRVFLRPGTVVLDPEAEIKKQQNRLAAYLVSEGYFEARVTISPTVVDGVEPNEGLHLDIHTEPGFDATIGEIVVRGDMVVPDDKLANIFRHNWIKGIPMRFRPAQFNDDLQAASKWVQDKGFPAAHVQGSFMHDPNTHKVRIELKLIAGSRVDIEFVGNTAFSDKALKGLATFEAAGAVDPVAIDELRRNIVRRYQSKGYVDVQVQPDVQRVDALSLKVRFTIDAGAKMPVRRVRFLGLPKLDVKALHKGVEFLSRPSSIWRNRYWVDNYVARDVRSLTAYLRKQGYSEAQVSAEREPWADESGLDIIFLVNPGARRLVANVELDAGDDKINAGELLPRLEQRAQKPFLLDRAHNDGQEIQAFLASKGYTNVSVEDDIDVPKDDPTAPVTIKHHIHLGPKARIGGMFIRGNMRTSRHILVQEMHSRPGDPLDLAALGLARRRLRSFNIFNTVQLSPLSPQADDPTTWLLLALEERDVKTLDGVASFSSDYRFSVGADYRDRNLFGRTMLLTVQLRLSDASELISPKLRIGNQDLLSINLKAPHPFGLPFDADAQLLYRYLDVTEYRERRMGGIASIGRPLLLRTACKLCPSVAGKLGYELTEAYRIDKVDETDASLSALPDTTIARVIPSINVNRRDNPIDTIRGYNYDLRLELGHPGLAGFLHENATAFYRILTGVQGYYPLGTPFAHRVDEKHKLGGPVVAAGALQYNVAGPWTAHGAVPASETFGYGGDFSVRGLINRASTQQIDNAHYMVTGSFELRWYAVPDLGFGTIQLAGFVDMGTVAMSLDTLFAQSTVSVGPVLRYVTPIGPLSLAYGKAVVLPAALKAAPDAAPPNGRVHLTFGYSF